MVVRCWSPSADKEMTVQEVGGQQGPERDLATWRWNEQQRFCDDAVAPKPVTLTMTTDNHYKSYRDSMILTFTIGNYPINNGSITVNFVNVNNGSDIKVKTILYSDLTTSDNITYTYTWSDISNLLSTNSYTMTATLHNQNFSGSYTDTSSALIINKNKLSDITIHIVNNLFL